MAHSPKTAVTNGRYEIDVSLWIYQGAETVGSCRANLSFDYDGARYHVWLDRETGALREPLYKNPPAGIERNAEGYFATRKLDLHARSSQKLIEAAIVQAGDYKLAYGAAYKAGQEKLATDQTAAAEAARIARAKEAGPELLAAAERALKLIGDLMPGVGAISLPDYALLNEAPIELRAAIAKAKGLS